MQLRPSLLLSTAAAALISMPLAAQGEFMQCVMQNMGLILPLLANTTELTGAVSSLCCGETDDPTCAALQCLDFEVRNFIHHIYLLHEYNAPFSTTNTCKLSFFLVLNRLC